MNTWLNLIAYQLTWLAAVAGAGAGLWWPGPVAAGAFAALVLVLGRRMRSDLILATCCLGAGLIFDGALIASGWVSFAAHLPHASISPAWMLACWLAFAMTLNHCMRALHGHHWVAALLGLFGAPLAYWAAADAWSAMTLHVGLIPFLAVIGVVWALLTPALLSLAARLESGAGKAMAPAAMTALSLTHSSVNNHAR